MFIKTFVSQVTKDMENDFIDNQLDELLIIENDDIFSY